ncbi:uncharacterized protein FA14DRAFT_156519 [Meira miltonrushii]|uniref:Zn(2)-C6 fungal-type domain-containing protein n=1 Tax=Meira miltonrushii TaxID=1280837 RepID=A0A316V8C5_9BASI|nr:uncharacterized protein FA14DRAFT_156519 [Meira miltonrushii]PWN33839.1 hypothetical protein FA14DRAFT_156519 [Meira miltonrushii]
MMSSPMRKDSQQQPISDWPRTPFSSRVAGMGAVVPSEWGSTISYDFNMTSFEDETSNILGDVPSVFDTPSQYRSNGTDFHPSQNTSARTSISPTISANQMAQNDQRYAALAMEDERYLSEYSPVNMSRDLSLMPSPSSSNEDGLALLSSGVPHHSYEHRDVPHGPRRRLGPYDLSHLQRRDAIVDPLHLIQNTMIPSVVLPRRESVPMLPAIVSRMPSPEEEYRHSIRMHRREPLYENRSPSPLPSVMQHGHPSCMAPAPGPSSHNTNMPSVFAQPQNPDQFRISSKALEMDGWTSSWPPAEEAKGKNKKNKGKATKAVKPHIPHPNYSRTQDISRYTKRDEDYHHGMPQHQPAPPTRSAPPPPPQQQQQPVSQPHTDGGRMFVEIKSQFHAIPENSDPSRFSSNGRCLIACEACKRRKMRCTNEFPTCSNCTRRGMECQYADKVRTRGKSKRDHLVVDENRSTEHPKSSLGNNRLDHKRRRLSTSISHSQQ